MVAQATIFVLKQCVDLCLQLSLADYTNMLVDNLAALDEYEGRNIANTVVCRDVVALLNIALTDIYLVGILTQVQSGTHQGDCRIYREA